MATSKPVWPTALDKAEKTEACFWFSIWPEILTNRIFGQLISFQNYFFPVLNSWVINHIKQIMVCSLCTVLCVRSTIFFISSIVLFDLHLLYYLAHSCPHNAFISFPDMFTYGFRNTQNCMLLKVNWPEYWGTKKKIKPRLLHSQTQWITWVKYQRSSQRIALSFICAAHHSSPHNMRSFYCMQQDHSRLGHIHLTAAARNPTEMCCDVNGDLFKRRKKKTPT